jgi:predicted phosphate transport protein (TIGR00153 family)
MTLHSWPSSACPCNHPGATCVTKWFNHVHLFPREEKFFELLEEQGVHIVEASRLLNDLVRADATAMAGVAGEIKRIEHAADKVTHQLFTRLNQTFVTPLDPEDLHSLGSALDDVVDYIEDAAFRLSAYRVHPVPKGVPELTEIIHQCCLRLQSAVGKLKNGRAMQDDCIEINRLENVADELVRKLVTALFNDVTDAIALLKYKEIYEVLELATDLCEDVADVLQTIVVKNS